jgi:hypothetical protein
MSDDNRDDKRATWALWFIIAVITVLWLVGVFVIPNLPASI